MGDFVFHIKGRSLLSHSSLTKNKLEVNPPGRSAVLGCAPLPCTCQAEREFTEPGACAGRGTAPHPRSFYHWYSTTFSFIYFHLLSFYLALQTLQWLDVWIPIFYQSETPNTLQTVGWLWKSRNPLLRNAPDGLSIRYLHLLMSVWYSVPICAHKQWCSDVQSGILKSLCWTKMGNTGEILPPKGVTAA